MGSSAIAGFWPTTPPSINRTPVRVLGGLSHRGTHCFGPAHGSVCRAPAAGARGRGCCPAGRGSGSSPSTPSPSGSCAGDGANSPPSLSPVFAAWLRVFLRIRIPKKGPRGVCGILKDGSESEIFAFSTAPLLRTLPHLPSPLLERALLSNRSVISMPFDQRSSAGIVRWFILPL